MRSKLAASDCHDPQLGMLIGEGWYGEGDRFPAVSPKPLDVLLEQVIREQIVPKLVQLHQNNSTPAASESPTSDEIEEFGRIVIGPDPSKAELFFESMRARGMTSDALFETLLAPTARRLGELWFEDVCDFVAVAIGVNRLRILLELYGRVTSPVGNTRRRALLISTPNEAHVFGLDMVASFMRASGWEVQIESARPAEENGRAAASRWFAVAGVTIADDSCIENAARAIEAVRRASLNRSISIMIGGWACHRRPGLVARVGGDATAEDGPSASLLAEKLYIQQFAGTRRQG